MLSNFTPRMALILAHDLVAAVAAVLAAFYIRFEAAGLAERWDLLLLVMPGFVLYAAGVFSIFGLYKNKWRFTSLPDLMNILKVSTVLAATLLAFDYVMLAPNVYGTFFFGKITIVLYWFLQILFLAGSRIGYRYFRYTRTLQRARRGDLAQTLVLGPAADAEVLLRGIESGAVKKIKAVGILSRIACRPVPVDARRPGNGRFRRPGADRQGLRRPRHCRHPAGDDTVGARARDEAGSHPDPGAPYRPLAKPDAVPRRGR